MRLNSKLYVNLSCAMSVNMRYSMFREFYFIPNCLSKEGRKKVITATLDSVENVCQCPSNPIAVH